MREGGILEGYVRTNAWCQRDNERDMSGKKEKNKKYRWRRESEKVRERERNRDREGERRVSSKVQITLIPLKYWLSGC